MVQGGFGTWVVPTCSLRQVKTSPTSMPPQYGHQTVKIALFDYVFSYELYFDEKIPSFELDRENKIPTQFPVNNPTMIATYVDNHFINEWGKRLTVSDFTGTLVISMVNYFL